MKVGTTPTPACVPLWDPQGNPGSASLRSFGDSSLHGCPNMAVVPKLLGLISLALKLIVSLGIISSIYTTGLTLPTAETLANPCDPTHHIRISSAYSQMLMKMFLCGQAYAALVCCCFTQRFPCVLPNYFIEFCPSRSFPQCISILLSYPPALSTPSTPGRSAGTFSVCMMSRVKECQAGGRRRLIVSKPSDRLT
ncbi:hypothetical protein KIL84_002840 [Mauremys mutica]|uniref:Uncharacterized protein n=1 Tax=Mauremys mutica TaxID=74926 RepID=A0A9D3WUG1_9SAUR|nr:hypothetical protein KIL84_002840 [Mauremys mutica]